MLAFIAQKSPATPTMVAAIAVQTNLCIPTSSNRQLPSMKTQTAGERRQGLSPAVLLTELSSRRRLGSFEVARLPQRHQEDAVEDLGLWQFHYVAAITNASVVGFGQVRRDGETRIEVGVVVRINELPQAIVGHQNVAAALRTTAVQSHPVAGVLQEQAVAGRTSRRSDFALRVGFGGDLRGDARDPYTTAYRSLHVLRDPAGRNFGDRRYVNEREGLSRESHLVEWLTGQELDAPAELPQSGQPHPPGDPLTPDELLTITRWIDLGATFRGG